MRADSIATSNIKNRIGSKGSLEKVADVRLLLEEKRQNSTGPRQANSTVKSGNFKFIVQNCAWLIKMGIKVDCSIAANNKYVISVWFQAVQNVTKLEMSWQK